MSCIHSELSWLPKAPETFKETLKNLSAETENLGSKLRELSTHSLDQNQLHRLTKNVTRLKEEGAKLEPLHHFKLGIIGNVTTELLPNALIGTALRHGINLEIHETAFNTMAQEALNENSALNNAKCDAILFVLDYKQMGLTLSPGDEHLAEETVENAFQQLMQIRAAVNKHNPTICLFPTLTPPVEALFGSLDRKLAGTFRQMISSLNDKLCEHASQTEDIICDQAALAEVIGLTNWRDQVSWYTSKLPFALKYVPIYADYVVRHISALCGKTRRVLVLDLDNTVWGGVIGDDGVEGIKIGNGSALGEAYLDIQKMALALRNRGIILAVCSKNNDDVARLPFQKHPDMILKEEHISVFQANWNDKASNIQAIADHLSLGLDSFVFLDDNPAERARVRQMLPQVAVPELPEEAELYITTLMAAGYFDAITFLDEDKKRADFYDSNAKRVQLKNTLGNFDDYLASLDMRLRFSAFDPIGRSRITQLINKSNQFNLTTRRYTEADIIEIENDQNIFALQARLEDSFGDNGMINVIICKENQPKTWEIDTWLMSCRVLERRVEEAILAEIMHHAKKSGIKTLYGRYIPTDRNALVIDHYQKLGFYKISAQDNGETVWEMDVASYSHPELPIEIEHARFE